MDLLSNYKFWLFLSVAMVALYIAIGGLKFINCIDALKGYKNIFKDNKGKIQRKHFLFFVTFPAVLAVASNLYSLVKDDLLSVVGVIISVMTSMLYAFMSIIDTKYEKISCEKECVYLDYNWSKIIYRETIDVITCEILVSVFLLILCFIQPLSRGFDYNILNFEYSYLSPQSLLSWLIYYCFYFFVLNLLMVTKRFYRFNQRKT